MARSEYQATNILHRLFDENPSSSELPRVEIFRAAGKSDDVQKDRDAVYSWISIPFGHGFISKRYSPENHGLMSIALTEKGARALGRGVHTTPDQPSLKASLQPTNTDDRIETSVPKVVTLEFATEVTDVFNAQNQHWEWKLVRKEVANKQ